MSDDRPNIHAIALEQTARLSMLSAKHEETKAALAEARAEIERLRRIVGNVAAVIAIRYGDSEHATRLERAAGFPDHAQSTPAPAEPQLSPQEALDRICALVDSRTADNVRDAIARCGWVDAEPAPPSSGAEPDRVRELEAALRSARQYHIAGDNHSCRRYLGDDMRRHQAGSWPDCGTCSEVRAIDRALASTPAPAEPDARAEIERLEQERDDARRNHCTLYAYQHPKQSAFAAADAFYGNGEGQRLYGTGAATHPAEEPEETPP